MGQIYKMKGSFDNKATWYQLEWNDVEFKEFETISKNCSNIQELNSKILEAFPECQLKYTYLGERKNIKLAASPKETKKTRKKK